MKKSLLLLLSLVALTFSGCGTTTTQTLTKMTRTISLDPYLLNNPKVYLRVTGTQASVLELDEPLKKGFADKGIEVVDNEEDATVYIHINTLFANNIKEAVNYAHSVGVGIVGGALAKGAGNSSGDSILIGIGVALAMGVVQSAMADETYRAIVDVSVRYKEILSKDWSNEEKTRVISEAVRMGLKVDEAKPTMEEQVTYKIVEILAK